MKDVNVQGLQPDKRMSMGSFVSGTAGRCSEIGDKFDTSQVNNEFDEERVFGT